MLTAHSCPTLVRTATSYFNTRTNRNYLEQVDADGAQRSRVFPFPILEFQGVLPGPRWVIAVVSATSESNIPAITAIPLAAGMARWISPGYCFPRWSTDGRFLFVPVEGSSRESPAAVSRFPLVRGRICQIFLREGPSIRRTKRRTMRHVREPRRSEPPSPSPPTLTCPRPAPGPSVWASPTQAAASPILGEILDVAFRLNPGSLRLTRER